MVDTKIKSLTETLGWLSKCCLENVAWSLDDVEEVILFADNDYYDEGEVGGGWKARDTYGGGSDVNALAIVKLKDDQVGLLESSEDYTGHGCQCSSYTGVYNDIEDLLYRGVPEFYRDDILALVHRSI